MKEPMFHATTMKGLIVCRFDNCPEHPKRGNKNPTYWHSDGEECAGFWHRLTCGMFGLLG